MGQNPIVKIKDLEIYQEGGKKIVGSDKEKGGVFEFIHNGFFDFSMSYEDILELIKKLNENFIDDLFPDSEEINVEKKVGEK
jgi:hypothetical protein